MDDGEYLDWTPGVSSREKVAFQMTGASRGRRGREPLNSAREIRRYSS